MILNYINNVSLIVKATFPAFAGCYRGKKLVKILKKHFLSGIS